MANKTVLRDYNVVNADKTQVTATAVPMRLTDNGDGTFSEGSSGGGGGGGAVTVADGADVTQGAKADAAATTDIGAFSVVALLKRLLTKNPLGAAATTASRPVNIATDDAAFGAEYTGYSQDTGGSGLRGTLSTIAKAVRQLVTSPTAVQDLSATGAITTQNLNATGAATAGSAVVLALNGTATVGMLISANTLTATLSTQVSVDGTVWQGANVFQTAGTVNGNGGTSSIGAGTTGAFAYMVAGYKFFRITALAATTGSASIQLNGSTAAGIPLQSVNLATINNAQGLAIASMNNPGGGAGIAMLSGMVAPTAASDINNQSWATASGSGATVTDLAGAACSFDVVLNTYTGGSAVGLDAYEEYSIDSGTTWNLMWVFDRLTAAGQHAMMPPNIMPGARRRTRWVNVNASNVATAATAATVTVTSVRHSIAPSRLLRQFYDYTAALLAGTASATTSGSINGVATAGAGYETGGATNISALITLGAAGTPATYQLQVCSFNSTTDADWANVGTATPAVASATTRIVASGITERFFRLKVTSAGTTQTGTRIALLAG